MSNISTHAVNSSQQKHYYLHYSLSLVGSSSVIFRFQVELSKLPKEYEYKLVSTLITEHTYAIIFS